MLRVVAYAITYHIYNQQYGPQEIKDSSKLHTSIPKSKSVKVELVVCIDSLW